MLYQGPHPLAGHQKFLHHFCTTWPCMISPFLCVSVQKTHRQQGGDSLASLLIHHFHFYSKQRMERNPVLLEDDLQQWEQCQHYLCF